MPVHLKKQIKLCGIDRKALTAFSEIDKTESREVDWNWNFATTYSQLYPKSFDLSIWYGNNLCSMSIGRPTFTGRGMRLDFIEKFSNTHPFPRLMFPISQVAFEAYGKLIGAQQLRIVKPMNKKLVSYYSSHAEFPPVSD